jgi:hypothetical protein
MPSGEQHSKVSTMFVTSAPIAQPRMPSARDPWPSNAYGPADTGGIGGG